MLHAYTVRPVQTMLTEYGYIWDIIICIQGQPYPLDNADYALYNYNKSADKTYSCV